MCTSQVMNSAVFLLFGLKEKAKRIIKLAISVISQLLHSMFLRIINFR